MTESSKDEGPSLEVTVKGISAKGAAYEDLRPAVKTTVEIVDTALKLVSSVIGLPTDYFRLKLESFRRRLRERLEAIPDEKRTNPPLRIGHSVAKEVPYMAEDSDIQEMFADLLATSCNTETQRMAHPGFANVITQLVSLDAKLLRSIASTNRRFVGIVKPVNLAVLRVAFGGNPSVVNDFNASIDNLLRLGLIEKSFNDHESKLGKSIGRVWQDASDASVSVTTFGGRFVLACLPPSTTKEVQGVDANNSGT